MKSYFRASSTEKSLRNTELTQQLSSKLLRTTNNKVQLKSLLSKQFQNIKMEEKF